MPFHFKLAMRAFRQMMKRKNPEETKVHELLASNYDLSDPKYLDPILEYLKEG